MVFRKQAHVLFSELANCLLCTDNENLMSPILWHSFVGLRQMSRYCPAVEKCRKTIHLADPIFTIFIVYQRLFKRKKLQRCPQIQQYSKSTFQRIDILRIT
jgi:hypothetical protein